MKNFLILPLYFCVILGALTLGACSEKNIYIHCEGQHPQEGPSEGNTSLMSFHASVESRNMSRALSPIQQNVQAHIFAFDAANIQAAVLNPTDQGSYIALTPGQLSGINNFKMNLPLGVYNFYGISDNSPFRTPSFKNGLSEPLLNGLDYLWWGGLKQDVSSAQSNIPVLFFHRATQVVFELTAGENIKLNSLVMAHLNAPIEGAQMTLTTGEIPPASAYMNSPSKMGVNGFTAQYIMLPMSSQLPMSVSFDLLLDGQSTPQRFETQLSLPDGQLKAGNSYLFKVVIKADQIELPSVNVAHWREVDETGKPLYPTAQ